MITAKQNIKKDYVEMKKGNLILRHRRKQVVS